MPAVLFGLVVFQVGSHIFAWLAWMVIFLPVASLVVEMTGMHHHAEGID
jgi:hypothetical protein